MTEQVQEYVHTCDVCGKQARTQLRDYPHGWTHFIIGTKKPLACAEASCGSTLERFHHLLADDFNRPCVTCSLHKQAQSNKPMYYPPGVR